MKSYDTVVQALQDLKSRGFSADMNLAFDSIHCPDSDLHLRPEDFEIVETYRFEGQTNPDDEDVVYAVSSKDGKLKGVLVSAFGSYSDPVSDEMIKKLRY